METLEQLEKKLTEAEDAYQTVLNNLPPGLDFESYNKAIQPASDKVAKLYRKIRMIKPYTLSVLPDYGNMMTLDEFISCCKSGGFIDYDGYGHYAKDDKMTDIEIYPSDVKNNYLRKEFNKIIWFNR